jgi:hypothetical protein
MSIFRASRPRRRSYDFLKTREDCIKSQNASNSLLLDLPNDIIANIFCKLDLENRFKVRLVCTLACALTPSPWKLAGDVLDGVNSFNVCLECGSKGYRDCAETCPCKEDPFEQGIFARMYDPRHDYEWLGKCSALSQKIHNMNENFSAMTSHEICNMMSQKCSSIFEEEIQKHAQQNVVVSHWASKNQNHEDKAEYSRFRLLLIFMIRSIDRLADHHMRIIQSILQTKKRRYRNLHLDNFEVFPEMLILRKKWPLRHQIMFALASLRLSTIELFGGCAGGLFRWRSDYPTSCGLRLQSETPHVHYQDPEFDSCLRFEICQEMYADFGRFLGSCPCCSNSKDIDLKADLAGVNPGSRQHFEHLLRPVIHPCLISVFGQQFCHKHFNSTRKIQIIFEKILSRLQTIEGGIHNCDGFGEVLSLNDDDSFMDPGAEDEYEEGWVTDDGSNDDATTIRDDEHGDHIDDFDDDDFDGDDDDDDDGVDVRGHYLAAAFAMRAVQERMPLDSWEEFQRLLTQVISHPA